MFHIELYWRTTLFRTAYKVKLEEDGVFAPGTPAEGEWEDQKQDQDQEQENGLIGLVAFFLDLDLALTLDLSEMRLSWRIFNTAPESGIRSDAERGMHFVSSKAFKTFYAPCDTDASAGRDETVSKGQALRRQRSSPAQVGTTSMSSHYSLFQKETNLRTLLIQIERGLL